MLGAFFVVFTTDYVIRHPGVYLTCDRSGVIFVLKGKLRTYNGVYGPRTWVWFPQGETMEHGATDEGDMVGIFITDGVFEIHYNDEK